MESTPALPPFFLSCSSWEVISERLPQAQEGFAAVADSEQRNIIFIGGFRREGEWLSFCEAFDVLTRIWKRLPYMTTERFVCAAVCYENTVYVLGGHGITGKHLRTIERFGFDPRHPFSHCWKPFSPSMTTKRMAFAATIVGKRIIVIGGCDEDSFHVLQTVEQFDIGTRQWSPLASMSEPRLGCAAVTVQNTVYVFGGLGSVTVEAYHTITATWEPLPDMPGMRACGAAVVVGGRYVLLVGGEGETNQALDRVDCFDTVTHQWMTLLPPLHTARATCAAVCVGNEVFVVGGADQKGNLLDTIERLEINPYYITVPRLTPLLQQDESLPLGLWPHVMACSSSPSVVYHILCSHKFRLDGIMPH